MTAEGKKNVRINKIIGFGYTNKIIGLAYVYNGLQKHWKQKGAIFSAKFLDNVNGLTYSKNVIYHSHITGDFIGNAQSYCNLKVRENKSQTCVIAHNLFGFHFFLGSWRTRNISIGVSNLININFANIANQLKFVDTLKYYQSLSVLTTTMTNQEKHSLKREMFDRGL